jgi:RNA 2',3'-cyclic 3'-phosphodiesterase
MRLFVGLRPPLAIREELTSLMAGVPGARWQSDEQLHITLRFIGEVDPRQAEDVVVALGNVTAPPLTLRLDGVGSFGSRGRPRALWAGVSPREPLAALHKKIDQALVRCGLPPEGRAYLPHATVARLGSGVSGVERWLAEHAGLVTVPFALDHFLLFESHLGSDGAAYEALARYALRSC